MKYGCPNQDCDFYKKRDLLVRDGFYFRKSDRKKIPRFKCKNCGKKFSNATFSLSKGQRKRFVNPKVYELLSSGVSMRRTARLLKINPKTVARKLDFLAKRSHRRHKNLQSELKKSKVSKVQFDDLITSVHTKLKPVSVTLAVEENSRKILAFEVSQIPAFGLIAEKSRKKYGRRKCFHQKGLNNVFDQLQHIVTEDAVFKSDEHQRYNPTLKRFFPMATHLQYKGGRGCVVGQGELKRLHYDPLFSLNHTCAMLRANINRLVRKTWCTSKTIEHLKKHIGIYVDFHNRNLIPAPT